MPAGGTVSFTASVQGTTDQGVVWQVNGVTGGNASVGTISPTGLFSLYTAPALIPNPAAVTVTAISQADSSRKDTATLTITVGVQISPSNATLHLQDAQCASTAQFSAQVTGSENTAVQWSVNGLAAGSPDASFGTISDTGLYTAPQALPDPLRFDVVAQSLADSSQAGRARVTLSSGGPGINRNAQTVPVLLGTSGGNVNDQSASSCCSGTLGALVTRGGKNFILSNAHVLARSGKASAGEVVGQPGLVDNACSQGEPIANFSQAVELHVGGTSVADAALAEVVDGQVDPSGSILQLGPLSCGVAQNAPPAASVATPVIGMPVAKSGRTTGLTCSTIAATNVTVLVDYDTVCGGSTTFTVTYNDQIEIDSATFSDSGDSGSLIVNAQTAEPVALLYAGDDTSTIANPIQTVLTALADPQDNSVVPTLVGGATHPVEACTGPVHATSVQGRAWVRPSAQALARAVAAKERGQRVLMQNAAVLGVGVGRETPGEPVIVVFVEQGKHPPAIPAQIDGVRTRVKAVKRFHAFGASCARGAAAEN
ncbi:MAG: hypothetical protein JST79_08150 [Acidobacteria bacterium]|nr:hypothetical protein [Acidobacteriota bacterium]